MSFLSELKRRNVIRVGTAYVVGSWLLIQVAETLFPLFGFDETPARIVVIVLAVGFVPALVLSWVFEWTPEGLAREAETDHARPVIAASAKRLDRIIMVVLALALGYFAFDKFVLSGIREAAIARQARQEGRSEGIAESLGDTSVAVLPFVNKSSDPEQDFFADGMTEEILNILARVPKLHVTARTSSFFFKGKNLPIAEIAQALNVRHILQGSIRKSGSRVRISAQLIDTGSDTEMWANSYDRDLQDIFGIQDEVASSIAAALSDTFKGLARKPVSRSDNVASFEAYRTGRLLWWRRSPKDLREAIGYFNKAIEHDPGFAPAYAAVADSRLLLSMYGEEHMMSARDKALPMIDKALSIDPDCSQAYAAQGLAALQIGDMDPAEVSLRRAIKIDGNYIPAYNWLAVLLGDLGRIPEEGATLQAALAKDPLNEVLTTNYSANLQSRGDSAGARKQIEGLLRLQPDSTSLLFMLSGIDLNSGDLVEAWKLAQRAHDLEPGNAPVIIALASAWMDLGDFDQADTVMYQGLAHVRRNVDFRVHYLFQLIVQKRVELAEQSLTELFGTDISKLPAEIQRTYHYYVGLISEIKNDPATERDELEKAINPDETKLWDNDQVFVLSTVAMLDSALGNADLAEQRLTTAERVVGHARLNGIDNGEIYYQTACLFALRGQEQQAVASLQRAYDKGWRQLWHLQRDKRLDSLRKNPAFQKIKAQMSADVAQARAAVAKLQSAAQPGP